MGAPDISESRSRPRLAKDRFTTVVFTLVALVLFAELFALFWLDLI